MTRSALALSLVLSLAAIDTTLARPLCPERLDTSFGELPPASLVDNGWTGGSQLPNLLFDFEDKDERGVHPYGFELSGVGEIGRPDVPGMTSSGDSGLVLYGTGPTRVEFEVPVEQLEFAWLDENHVVKGSISAYDTDGQVILRDGTTGPVRYDFHYFDSSRPISYIEFETQSKTFISVVDDLGVRHRETAQTFCSGDGQTVGCPCANESEIGAFEGCINSSGRGARMHSLGRDVVALGELRFFVSGLPAQRPALLLEGTQDGVMYPFRDGLLCLGHLRRRLDVALSDVEGSLTFGGSIFEGSLVPQSGDVLDYQCWFRDPLVSTCGTGSGFSQAQRVYWN
jgi:hypothetical protein